MRGKLLTVVGAWAAWIAFAVTARMHPLWVLGFFAGLAIIGVTAWIVVILRRQGPRTDALLDLDRPDPFDFDDPAPDWFATPDGQIVDHNGRRVP